MPKLTAKQKAFLISEAIREDHLVEVGQMVEQFARELDAMGLVDYEHLPMKRIVFEQGLSVIGAHIASQWIRPNGEYHLMIETPDLGNVWIVYGRGS